MSGVRPQSMKPMYMDRGKELGIARAHGENPRRVSLESFAWSAHVLRTKPGTLLPDHFDDFVVVLQKLFRRGFGGVFVFAREAMGHAGLPQQEAGIPCRAGINERNIGSPILLFPCRGDFNSGNAIQRWNFDVKFHESHFGCRRAACQEARRSTGRDAAARLF